MPYVSAVAAILLAILVFAGWTLNIIALVAAPMIGGLELVRVVGIFVAPLGVILGLFV